MSQAIAACCVLSSVTSCTSGASTGKDGADQAGSSAVLAGPHQSFDEILNRYDKLSSDELKLDLKAVYQDRAVPDSTRWQAAYILGRLLQKGGSAEEQKEALPLFEEAGQLKPLWERCQWHIAECAATCGKEKSVRSALEAIKEKTETPDSRAAADYGLAQSYLRANEAPRAREAFESIRKQYSKSQYALGSAFYLAQMDLSKPETVDSGVALLREYLQASPDGHFARDILIRLSSLKDFRPAALDEDLFAQVHFVHGEWQEALDAWSKSGGRKHWFEQAVCLAHLGRQGDAANILKSGLKNFKNDSSTPAAAAMLAKMSSKEEAVAIWRTVLQVSPKFGDLAMWNLSLRSQPGQALAYYKQILQKFPNSDYAPESRWWVIWDQAKHGHTAQALQASQAAFKQYPQAKARARFAFWIGKFQERLKHKDLAQASYKQAVSLFASQYYGWRASERLKAIAGGKDRGWQTQPARAHPDTSWSWPQPPELMSYEAIAKGCGETASVLGRLHQFDECLAVLPSGANALVKAWCMANLGLPLDAINTARSNLSGAPDNSPRWQYSYPLLYAADIANQAKTRSLDPLLVHALIREESRYNHMAVSRSNALGLMQLLPATAYGVAKRLGIPLGGQSDIHKPENNLAMGTEYLSYLLKRFQGNALFAVAGYNGGPNAVQTWSHHPGASDLDSFVEDVPVLETRDYIRKVFGSYWNYESIYVAGK